jgi:2'-5' RNA ligase
MEQSSMSLSFPLHSSFLALPLEGEAKAKFQEVQNRLRSFENLFRFQNPKTPHLNLYFWEELLEIEYGQVVRKAEEIAARTEPFLLMVIGSGTFGEDRGKLPRVLFLSIARSGELARLKKLCPWPNRRPFVPHITLARMRNPNAFRVHRKKIMKLLKNVSFPISCGRLRLYAEVDGVKQTPIQDFVFV